MEHPEQIQWKLFEGYCWKQFVKKLEWRYQEEGKYRLWILKFRDSNQITPSPIPATCSWPPIVNNGKTFFFPWRVGIVMHGKETKIQSPGKSTILWQTLQNLIQIGHFLQRTALKQILDKQKSRSIIIVSFLIWNAKQEGGVFPHQYVYNDSP